TLTPIALNLMDAHGRTVHTNGFATGEQQKTIDTSEFASGLYILQFNTQQGVVRNKVMVVHEKEPEINTMKILPNPESNSGFVNPLGSQVFTFKFIRLKHGSPVAGVPYFPYF